MPMYFPNLKSIQQLATNMSKNKGSKRYTGIYPETEEELYEARQQLAKYLRNVWKDEIFAMGVELGVSEENYDARMQAAIYNRLKLP